MNIDLLDKTKKNKILDILEENYGILKMPHLFLKSGDRIRVFSGNLSKEELNTLGKNLHVDLIGTKLGTIAEDNFRLSFDIMNLPIISSQITKNIIEIDNEMSNKWLRGGNIDIIPNTENKFISIKNNDDFLGIARNHKTYLQNYVPKERKIKSK